MSRVCGANVMFDVMFYIRSSVDSGLCSKMQLARLSNLSTSMSMCPHLKHARVVVV